MRSLLRKNIRLKMGSVREKQETIAIVPNKRGEALLFAKWWQKEGVRPFCVGYWFFRYPVGI